MSALFLPNSTASYLPYGDFFHERQTAMRMTKANLASVSGHHTTASLFELLHMRSDIFYPPLQTPQGRCASFCICLHHVFFLALPIPKVRDRETNAGD
jgi:hypothetical protein